MLKLSFSPVPFSYANFMKRSIMKSRGLGEEEFQCDYVSVQN